MADTTNVFNMKTKLCRVRYAKDSYVVAEYATTETIPDEAVCGFDSVNGGRMFVAVGHGLPTQLGQFFYLSGVWEYNKKYNSTQFMVQDCVDCVERSKDAIVAYLSSKIIKGIGRATAEKIYEHFGDKTLEILAENPRRLMEVKGISAKRLNDITRSYSAHQDMHILTRMLAPHDVSYRMIVRIRETLGEGAAVRVRENPYCLCRVWGIGFLKADEVAQSMGVAFNSPFRIEGGIIYTLRTAMETKGHTYLTRANLVEACVGNGGVLCSKEPRKVISNGEVDLVISKMLRDKKLIAAPSDEYLIDAMHLIFLPEAYYHETVAAKGVQMLLSSAGEDSEKARELWRQALESVEQQTGIVLSPEQREGVLMALQSPFSIITGGPGSGKTTSLSMITTLYKLAFPDDTIMLAAPTGRAARRMSQQTGMFACTLHKLLGLTPGSKTDFTVPCLDEELVDADFLIVDESSMIDAALFAELMLRMTTRTKLLMLGDVDQLPSVGAGNVLRELLSLDGVVPFVKLNKVFRQSKDSIIPTNAAKVRSGDTRMDYVKGQFSRQLSANEDDGAERIEALVLRLIELGRWKDTQILCPMKRRGSCCTKALNERLHDIVNPPSLSKGEATIGGVRFRVGDKVMMTKNTPEVSNGDIGYIQSFLYGEDMQTLAGVVVQFENMDEPLEFDYDTALELEPAIAMTIHKSQGSEFPIVIMPIFKSMKFFLRRNLFYTAITRAKEHAVIVTDDDGTTYGGAVTAAIQTEDTSKRNTLLAEFIKRKIKESK